MRVYLKQRFGGDTPKPISRLIRLTARLAGLHLVLLSLVAVRAERWAPPTTTWTRLYGGSAEDELVSIHEGRGGLILLAGDSSSTNGTRKAQTYGSRDFWLVAIDQNGDVLWEKSYGGEGTEVFRAAAPLPDGGWIVAGASGSAPGASKEGAFFGGFDYWLVRLDAAGNKIWDRTYGGEEDDFLNAVAVLRDGTFILAGNSNSPQSGNKTTPCDGFEDGWVLRVNDRGEILWQQSFGGVGQDRLNAVALRDQGLLLLGSSDSPRFGRKTSPAWGFLDYWLLRINSEGTLVYEKSFGGDRDDYGMDVVFLPDGGALLTGSSASAQSGMKKSPNWTPGNGVAIDAWIIRLDENGNVLWENSFGGENGDQLSKMIRTSDGRLLGLGYSYSPPSGNKTSSLIGSSDLWLMRLDSERETFWQESLGTIHPERPAGAVQLATGEFLIAGTQITREPGDAPGGADFAVYKLSADLPQLICYPEQNPLQGFRFTLYGVPNKYYRTEFSHDLVHWTGLSTNWLNGSKLLVRDLTAPNSNARFYRVESLVLD